MGSWENTTEHPKSTHMYDPVRMVSTFALSNFARAYDSHPPNGELERAPVNGWYLVEVTIEKKVNGQWEWYDWDYWTVERD